MNPGRNDRGQSGAGSRIDMAALVTLFNAGRFAALEPQARELVRQDPTSGIGWKVLGVSLLMQRKDAVSALTRATELLPRDAEVHCNLGSAWVELGRFDAAVASCTRALEIDPRLAEAHNNLGNGLRGLGRLPEAVANYRRALELKPDFADAHHNLGMVLQELGRFEEAVASLQRALEIKPKAVGYRPAGHRVAASRAQSGGARQLPSRARPSA
jgi:protein O-GlcNAc transferase